MNNMYGLKYTLRGPELAPMEPVTYKYGPQNQPNMIANAQLAVPTVLVLPTPKPPQATNPLRTYVQAAINTIKYTYSQTGDLNNPLKNDWDGFAVQVNGVPNWARFLNMVAAGRFSTKGQMGFDGAALLSKFSNSYPAEIVAAASYGVPSGFEKAASTEQKKASEAKQKAYEKQLLSTANKIEKERDALQAKLTMLEQQVKAQAAAKGAEDATVKVLKDTLTALKAELAKREAELKNLLGEKPGIPIWALAVGGLAVLLILNRAGKKG